MEASALHAPSLTRIPLGAPLLRLRSDEQLLALFRAGSEEAFGVIHDRYRQRLFAYVRQMLSQGPRQDAEDVMQDVFVRAYGALRADSRDVNLRAWLYRVAHNRCIDHLRRPTPPAAEIFEMSRKPLHDPIEEAQRREDLVRLVEDVSRLPEQQRSALLMREIDGMSYADLAAALDVTVPAVKSLLVRARVGLVEAAEARDADCCEIRDDLMASYDKGVKASGRARKHMRSCAGCREYRTALRGMRRSFAALTPVSAAATYALAGFPALAWVLVSLIRRYRPTLRGARDVWRRLLQYGGRSYGVDLCSVLAIYLDQAMVVGLLSAASMGIYAVALNLSRVIGAVHGSVAMMVFPRVVGLAPEAMSRAVARSARMGTIVGCVMGVAVLVSGPALLQWLYGPAYRPASQILQILVCQVIVAGLVHVLLQGFLAAGRPGVATTIQLTGLACGVPLFLVLVPRFGVSGAAVALLLSSTLRLILTIASYRAVLGVATPRVWIDGSDLAEFAHYRTALVESVLRLRPAAGEAK